jgi:hypothetical protein
MVLCGRLGFFDVEGSASSMWKAGLLRCGRLGFFDLSHDIKLSDWLLTELLIVHLALNRYPEQGFAKQPPWNVPITRRSSWSTIWPNGQSRV